MVRPSFVPHLVGAALLATACAGPTTTTAADTTSTSPAAAPANQDERMGWWRDARFGMFVHWGLYAIPAGKWGDQTSHGEWIRTTAQIPLETYDGLQAQWNPTAFDADTWVRLAKRAGMGYLVVTSKHHDGFCLWDSAHTDWDVGNTQHRQDILRALKDACDQHGVRFCTYHSIMDWHHPDYLPRRDWETTRSTAGADFARFERYLHAQVEELVTGYQPAVMWFDGEWESTWSHERGVKLFEHCRQLAPTMIVNNRVDVHRAGMQGFAKSDDAVGDFQTPEQEIPPTGVPGVDWESCMTMNSHWGWNAYDTNWKSTTTLLRNLIDIASKGGNYLLNIGPRADGSFPPESVQRLQEIGAWMDLAGESIVGTSASLFEHLDFGRCTVKRSATDTKLYLHVFDLPKDGMLRLPGLAGKVLGAKLLNGKGTVQLVAIDAAAAPTDFAVHLALREANPHATVVLLTMAKDAMVYRTPTILAESEQFVHGLAVQIAGDAPGMPVHYTLDGSTPTAQSPRATGALQLAATATVRAAGFANGRRVTEVAARTFTKVDPLPPVEPVAPNEGLHFTEYAVDWDCIPEPRDGWQVTLRGTTNHLAVGKAKKERHAVRYTGFLTVGSSDLYRFRLTSDDGSKLWIGGQLVVDNDGLHGAVAKDGAVALGEGLHTFELVYFNKTGGAELSLRWARLGEGFVEVPAAALRH